MNTPERTPAAPRLSLGQRIARFFQERRQARRQRWMRRSMIGLAVAGVSLGALSACSHGPHAGWCGGHGASMSEADAAQWRTRMVERVASKLELDAPQKQHLAALADTLAEQRKLMREGRDGAAATAAAASGSAPASADPRAQVKALIAGTHFDAQAAQSLLDRKTDAVKAAGPKVIAAFGTFYDSLRPEQQQKVREFLDKAGRHGPGWMS